MEMNRRNISTIFLILGMALLAIGISTDNTIFSQVSIAFILIFLIAKLIILTANPFYLLVLSVYGIDSILTILYRLWNNENIFEAHRKHLYQLLANEYKIPHIKVASTYAIIQFIISLLIYFAITKDYSIFAFWTIGLSISTILILIYAAVRIKIAKSM